MCALICSKELLSMINSLWDITDWIYEPKVEVKEEQAENIYLRVAPLTFFQSGYSALITTAGNDKHTHMAH